MKKIAKGNRGVTLVALIISIVVLLILASVATVSGIGVINSSNLTTFTAEMKIMQTQVNNMYQKYKANEMIQIGDTKYTGEQILTIGEDISVVSEQANLVFKAETSGITDKTGYRYFSQGIISGLQIEGVEGAFFVNIEKRSVISYKGLKYEDQMYYTLNQLPKGLYNVEYENKNTGKPTFDVSYDTTGTDKWKITVSNIQYDGYINKWQVKYQLKGNNFWSTSEDLSFAIKEEGIYKIKIVNDTIESDEKELIITKEYNKDGLVLHLDAINNTGEGDQKHNNLATKWKDLSGNGNDATLINVNYNDTSGWQNNSLQLDGIDDYASIADNTTMKPVQQTIEMIVNRTGNAQNKGDGRAIVFVRWYGYTLELNPISSNQYTISYGRKSPYLASTTKQEIGKMVKISAIQDENNISKLYINGTYESQQTITPLEYSKMNYTQIGRYESSNSLLGNVYSVRMYNRALTEQEIEENNKIDKIRFEL